MRDQRPIRWHLARTYEIISLNRAGRSLIAVGNAVGPIVQAATNSTVIAGKTYTGNLGATDANANFTY